MNRSLAGSASAMCLVLVFAMPTFSAAVEGPARSSSSAKAVNHSSILKVSQEIDRLVGAKLKATGQSRNPLASDEIFVRRIYLDIAGRIPNLDETTSFLQSDSENKRAELIDELLDSYGYVSRQFNFWADLLRIKTRNRNIVGQPYIDFVKDSLKENKPYDEFVREMLASSGPMLERDNGQVGYYLRDEGMPEDNMSNTIRIFLGTRLECAQCHDHPFDKWTQRQYFEMVAFTGGMQYRQNNANFYNKIRQAARKNKSEITQQQRQVLRRMIQPLTIGVSGSGTGLARLPEGFMGDDGEEGDIVVAKTMFDGSSLVDPQIPKAKKMRRRPKNNRRQQVINGAVPIDSREAYADWLTDSDNPRFAAVIANRLWKQTMGLGLIEPVDMLDDGTEASNPELMEYLTQTMVELDFDMKQFLRAIYNSRTYQSSAVGTDIPDPLEFGFSGPVVRRMTAEQLWDSLLVLLVPDVDERAVASPTRYAAYFGTDDIYEVIDQLKKMTPDEMLALVEKLTGKAGQSMMAKERNKERRKEKEVRNRVRRLNKQLQQARRGRKRGLQKKLMAERAELMASFKKKRRGNGYRRASELQSPAPAGHFLREFGQSDREQIENGHTEPAVTQVLSLMNGFIESQISSNQNTILMTNIIEPENNSAKVEAAFLTMLSRKPNSNEMANWSRDLKKDGYGAVSDMIWVLANSNEFIFVK